jgi:hypothetical protein
VRLRDRLGDTPEIGAAYNDKFVCEAKTVLGAIDIFPQHRCMVAVCPVTMHAQALTVKRAIAAPLKAVPPES